MVVLEKDLVPRLSNKTLMGNLIGASHTILLGDTETGNDTQ